MDGRRIDVELEFERRAALRERARRDAGTASPGGPVEVRAIIPARVVAVSVAATDSLESGSRSALSRRRTCRMHCGRPARTRWRVGVAVGDTIEAGDLPVAIH